MTMAINKALGEEAVGLSVLKALAEEFSVKDVDAKRIVFNEITRSAVLDALCGIEQAYITTVHSYTADQSLHDRPHKDLRRARAAGQSIIPTTTGAAKALTRIFPHIAPHIGGCGIRVPVPNGSLTDITANVGAPVTIERVNAAFEKAAATEFRGILAYTQDPIVSVDINNSSHSCTFDSKMTSVIGKMVKIIGWYDNETGYCARLIDVVSLLKRKAFL